MIGQAATPNHDPAPPSKAPLLSQPKPATITSHGKGVLPNWPGSGSCWPSAALSCLTRRLSPDRGGGEYSHQNPELFTDEYGANLATLGEDYQKHGENLHRYDFKACPIWAISEVMSLG